MMRKVGRLCPSEDELAPFFAALVPQGVSKRAGLTIHEGRLGAHPVAALYSGVCKVNAAIAAQTLIDAWTRLSFLAWPEGWTRRRVRSIWSLRARRRITTWRRTY